ncbi:MAG: 4a-hydroxytetrahydrobiopterin dehydratase, partial [Actinomycetota bacterium]
MSTDPLVSRADFDAASLAGWHWRDGDVPALVAGYRAASYTDAAAFALEVARASDAAVHHPDIDVRYQRHTRITMTTHGSGGVTQL